MKPTVTGTSAQPTTRRVMRRKGLKGNQAGQLAARTGLVAAIAPDLSAGVNAGVKQGGKQASAEIKLDKEKKAAATAQSGIRDTVEALAKLQYAGQLSALKTQAAQVPQYMADYRRRIQELQNGLVGPPPVAGQQGQLGGVYGNAVNSVGQLGQTLSGGALAQMQQQAGQPVVDGATVDPNLAGDAAKAAAVRAQMTGNFGGLLASQGATENSYLANRSSASGPLELQAQMAVAKNIADAKRDKGAFKVAKTAELQAQQREAQETALRDQIALESLLGDQKDKAAQHEYDRLKLQFDKLHDVEQIGADKAADANTINKWGYTNGEWRAMSPQQRQQVIKQQASYGHTDTSSGGDELTPAQKQAQTKETNQAISDIRDLIAKHNDLALVTDKHGNYASPHQIRQKMRADGASVEQVKLAHAVASGKPLTKHEIEIAHALGISEIPEAWHHKRESKIKHPFKPPSFF